MNSPPLLCQLDGLTCVQCKRTYRHAKCEWICRSTRKLERRPRTREEIKAIHQTHCEPCEHYIREPNELTVDGMVCALKAQGCGACKSFEVFYEYLKKGGGCADKKHARFAATEVVSEDELKGELVAELTMKEIAKARRAAKAMQGEPRMDTDQHG